MPGVGRSASGVRTARVKIDSEERMKRAEAKPVEIFGKDTWPYTTAAREDYAKRKIPFVYINVKTDAKELNRMVRLSGGRQVPVIVDGSNVTVGFGGTW